MRFNGNVVYVTLALNHRRLQKATSVHVHSEKSGKFMTDAKNIIIFIVCSSSREMIVCSRDMNRLHFFLVLSFLVCTVLVHNYMQCNPRPNRRIHTTS